MSIYRLNNHASQMVVQFHTVWLWMRLLDYKCGSNDKPLDKTNKMTVRPAKTQISLGIRPVWSESSLCAQWVAKDPSFLHADSEDPVQTGRMPRLIWVFAGRTWHFVLFFNAAAQMKNLLTTNITSASFFCLIFFFYLNLGMRKLCRSRAII